MWDNPRLLTGIANGLFALALALLLFGAARALVYSEAFPLRAVRIAGDPVHVGRESIARALQGRVRGGFFSVDLDAVREGLEAIPWVRRAEVRRTWPDQLEVRLEEHVVLARWAGAPGGRLLNVYGEIFSGDADATLPELSGPPGSEREVARRFAQFREILAPLDLDPTLVALSQRFAWQLRLSNGLSVQLGRDSEKAPVRERLARFVELYPQTLGALGRRFEYVDLRYANGFALRAPGGARPAPDRTARARGRA